MKEFKTVTLTFGKQYVDILKKAMKQTISGTHISNDSIEFTDMGFKIIEPINEGFLFSFAMNYGKLLNLETLKKIRSLSEETSENDKNILDEIHKIADDIIYQSEQ